MRQRGQHQIHYKKKTPAAALPKKVDDTESSESHAGSGQIAPSSANSPAYNSGSLQNQRLSYASDISRLQKQLAQVQQLQQQQLQQQQLQQQQQLSSMCQPNSVSKETQPAPAPKEVQHPAMPTPVLTKATERYLDICWKDCSDYMQSAKLKRFHYVLEMRVVSSSDRKSGSSDQRMYTVYHGDDLNYRVTTVQPGTQYQFSVRFEGPSSLGCPPSPLLSCSTPGVPPSTEHPPIKSNVELEAEAKREREQKEKRAVEQAKLEKAKAAELKRKAAAEKAEREAALRKAREKDIADKKAQEEAAYEREKQRIIDEFEANRLRETQEIMQRAATAKREKELKMAQELQAKLDLEAKEREQHAEKLRLEAAQAREMVVLSLSHFCPCYFTSFTFLKGPLLFSACACRLFAHRILLVLVCLLFLCACS